MLYIIGTGLHSYKDISLRSIEILKKCKKIYFENYTSIQQAPICELSNFLNKKIYILDRNSVETEEMFFEESKYDDISILVVGTPMFATTHTGLLITAKQLNIKVEVIHNASIQNVLGCLGLYSYNFGKTISIPYFTDTWKPRSFLDNINQNRKINLHTLCLLDIKVDENRFMTANEALKQILMFDDIHENFKVFVIARFGSPDQVIKYDTIKALIEKDFGNPLHSIVIPGEMDVIEKEMVEFLFN